LRPLGQRLEATARAGQCRFEALFRVCIVLAVEPFSIALARQVNELQKSHRKLAHVVVSALDDRIR